MTVLQRILFLGGLAPVLALGLTACEREGPAERVGESIDRAGDDVEDAAEDVEDAFDD